MQRRSFSWVALVGVALAGVVAVSAATALAARSAASPFELVFQGRYEALVDGDVYLGSRLVGTFTSGAPFCESGTADDALHPGDTVVRYTCSDGSGSLTLTTPYPSAQNRASGAGEWTIVEGSGRYAGLRGKGTHSVELLDGDPEAFLTIPFGATFQGSVDADAVAPSLAFTSASATKLRRPQVARPADSIGPVVGASGAYAIHVALSLRDDVEGNTVAYRLRVTEGPEHPRDRRRIELASKEGRTASGSVSTTLRVFPSSKRVRSVKLRLSGSDPVGNEVSLVRSLKLPR
jgi:hypothetical protein